MANIELLVASTSGNTEFLAYELEQYLTELGHTCCVHEEPDFATLTNSDLSETIWICCVASHGAGDYGDSMLDFAEHLHAQPHSFHGLRYVVIAIGDSCYDTFCAAGKDCDQRLHENGAIRLATPLEIDMSADDPEQKTFTWIKNIQNQL